MDRLQLVILQKESTLVSGKGILLHDNEKTACLKSGFLQTERVIIWNYSTSSILSAYVSGVFSYFLFYTEYVKWKNIREWEGYKNWHYEFMWF